MKKLLTIKSIGFASHENICDNLKHKVVSHRNKIKLFELLGVREGLQKRRGQVASMSRIGITRDW
jgi:hypothetical protein